MHPNKLVALLVVLLLCIAGCTPSGELNTRITANEAGPKCDRVVIGVTRYYLNYPFLAGMSGWGRGVPTVHDMTGEIYLYSTDTSKLKRIASIKAPSRWKDDTVRFSIYPRILPNNELIFMLRGCPKDNQNCDEASYYHLTQNGKYSEMNNWPDASKEESESYQRCTSYLTYKDGITFVSIGPTGGPWRPLLSFKNNELIPIK